jgi:hypothetical protein
MSWRLLFAVCIVGLAGCFALASGALAEADWALGVCKPGVTDDRLMPLPAALVDRARQVFGLAMPDEMIRRTTVYRCMDGKTWLCTTGANLACGKADRRRDLPGVADWCRDHPASDTVPMFVIGHNTPYRWRCASGTPSIEATVAPVDARGFLSRNWKDAGR